MYLLFLTLPEMGAAGSIEYNIYLRTYTGSPCCLNQHMTTEDLGFTEERNSFC
jgi:hypothetical protein